MPPGAISLAVAASVYPPAVAAVIALGRGSDVRLRVVLLVAAALITVFATGALMLLLITDAGLTGSHHRTAGAGLEIAIGVVLLGLAYWLRRPRAESSTAKPSGPSKTARYLESRHLVLTLGFILYVVPSPIYLAAVKVVADAHVSTSAELADLAVITVVMLWMIELPMVMLIFFPVRAAATLEGVNAWFAHHGRTLAVVIAAGVGLYLIVAGVAHLLS